MAGSMMTRRSGELSPLWSRDPFGALREEIGDLRARFFGDDDEGWLSGTSVPSIDLAETDTTIEVRMDLPGIKGKDIDVQLNGNVLTITGRREEERDEKGRTFHRVERRIGSFSRSISLPCPVSESEVAAECQDGVLTITLPKTEESKARRIKVKG